MTIIFFAIDLKKRKFVEIVIDFLTSRQSRKDRKEKRTKNFNHKPHEHHEPVIRYLFLNQKISESSQILF